jgi:hypothetical protein
MNNVADFSFEDRLGLLFESEMLVRGNKQLQSRLKTAKLRLPRALRISILKQVADSTRLQSCLCLIVIGCDSIEIF